MTEGWPDADFCLDAPLRSPANGSSFLGVPYSAANIPNKNKNETATAPSRFFKKKEKNRTSCRRLHRMETTPLQVDAVPWESAGRSGILPLYLIGKALAFDA